MNITLTTNTGLWRLLQRLFASKPADRTVLEVPAYISKGINRTEFMGYSIKYPEPVLPAGTVPTRHLIRMFGIKRHTATFRKLTIASQNNFKTA